MQPKLTQVPPRNLRSTSATDMPAAVSRPASGGPACPPPTMIASKLRMSAPSGIAAAPVHCRHVLQQGSPAGRAPLPGQPTITQKAIAVGLAQRTISPGARAPRRAAAATGRVRREERTMGTLTTKDGVSLYYKDWGSGPPGVLSHGWT